MKRQSVKISDNQLEKAHYERQITDLKQQVALLAEENKSLLEGNNFNERSDRLACLNEAVRIASDTKEYNNVLVQARKFHEFVKTGKTE